MKIVPAVTAVFALLCLGIAAQAVTIATVPVGNAGNAGELSGAGAGGYGPDRITGSVSYNYNIGKYEVTAAQYKDFLNAVAQTDTYGLYDTNMWNSTYGCKIKRSGVSGSYTYSVASALADRPVNYVSWGDAARFANWLHNGQPTGAQGLSTTEDGAYYLNGATTDAQLLAVNRKTTWKWAITSEDEWYKAAYHKNSGVTGNYWDYPTGTNSAPGRDMTEITKPGNNANYSDVPYPIDSPYYTTVVGEFQYSRSPYGTFDQGGNLWEWNEAIVSGTSRGSRGGSFYAGDYVSTLQASMRGYTYPTVAYQSIGFRVAQAVPEPSSIIVLVGGLVSLLGMRRRRA